MSKTHRHTNLPSRGNRWLSRSIILAILTSANLHGWAASSRTAPARNTSENPPASPRSLQQIQQETRQIVAAVDHLTAVAGDVEKKLELLQAPSGSLQKLRGDYTNLLAHFRILTNQVAGLAQPARVAAGLQTAESAEALREKRDRLRGERDELLKTLAGLRARLTAATNQPGIPAFEPAANMHSVDALLSKNRVVPVRDPYFTFETGYVQRADGSTPRARIATRAQEGENIAQALEKGGCLEKFLSEMKPRDQYVRLIVCPDSIPAFRLAISAIKKQGAKYSWYAYTDRPIVYTSGSTSDRVN